MGRAGGVGRAGRTSANGKQKASNRSCAAGAFSFLAGQCDYASTLITTRRFWARPSFVLFGATGLSSP
jgi:hypothetical protein